MTRRSCLAGAFVICIGVLSVSAAAVAQEAAAAPAPTGPVAVERVSHVNSSLVLFDKDGRRYAVPDGRYSSESGAFLEIFGGRIKRMVGCGAEPCDLEIHSTRVVGRGLLLYAETPVPDGKFENESGGYFEIVGGEIVMFSAGGEQSVPQDGEQ